MSNNLRTRDGLPYNFVNGIKVRGMDIESLIPGIEGIPEAGSKYQFAGNGVNRIFTLPVTPYNKDAIDVHVKQLYVHPDDYTLVGDTLTLVEAPPALENGETYNLVVKVNLTTLTGYVTANRVSFEGENLDSILEKAKSITNYPTLRAYAGTAVQVHIADPGIEGFFYWDPADTSSTDNGGTVIVSSNGRRWKRHYSGAVNVKWFGVKGNGTTDDTASLQLALNSCAASGGNLVADKDSKILILGNLTIHSNVSFKGPHVFVGTPQDNSSAPYQNVGGSILLDPTKSITMNGGSSISGFFIRRNNMAFPSADTAAFTGTAVIANGDDVGVSHCMILGFNKAYYSFGKQRPRIHNVYFDCLHGIDIAECYDIAYVTECHAWPFATIALPGAPLIRSGIAYSFHDGGDWNKLTNCFSYGYSRGCTISNANSVTISGCGFDNVPGGNPSAIGIEIIGNCEDTRIVNCQTAAHGSAGIFINTATGTKTSIIGHNVWGGMSHGILIYGGNVTIRSTGFRSLTHAISVINPLSDVDIDDSWFRDLTGVVINSTVQKANVRLGNNCDFTNVVSDPTSNLTLPAVAALSELQLPTTGSVFYITGNTNIGTLTHAWPGRQITLVFTSTLNVLHSTGAVGSIRLNGSVNFSAAPGSTLTLCGIGGKTWNEIGRSV